MNDGFDPTRHELAQLLTRVERNQTHPNQRWRDAATLILIDRSEPTPEGAAGAPSCRPQVPARPLRVSGRRVERSDGRMPVATQLHAAVEARLLKRVSRPSPYKARAFALAAIRETFEETGLLIGRKQEGRDTPAGAPPCSIGRGLSRSRLACISSRVRSRRRGGRAASTPVSSPPTRTAIAHRVEGVVGPDAELVELVWLPITEVERLEMPTITKVALQELEARSAAGFGHDLPVPFYRMLHRRFVREVL